MIKVTVLYPNNADARFDMAYFTSKHMRMVQRKCGPACKAIAAERGLSGSEPRSEPTYIAMGHLIFNSVEAYQTSFGLHVTEILADVPNYTNIKPILQVSEITL